MNPLDSWPVSVIFRLIEAPTQRNSIQPGIPWAHLDVMAWNNRARPGRPEGAEAQTLRALYAHIAGRFG